MSIYVFTQLFVYDNTKTSHHLDKSVTLWYTIYEEVDNLAVSKNNVRVPITIPKELKQQLENLAKEDKRTFSNLCAKILSDYVQQKKDGE